MRLIVATAVLALAVLACSSADTPLSPVDPAEKAPLRLGVVSIQEGYSVPCQAQLAGILFQGNMPPIDYSQITVVSDAWIWCHRNGLVGELEQECIGRVAVIAQAATPSFQGNQCLPA